MPFARLSVSQPLAAGIANQLSHELTKLISTELRKNYSLTSVLIEELPMCLWTISGNEQSICAHLEVNVTAGTNSIEEKQRFISKAMASITSHLHNLNVATYVIVREIPADDWGYGGLTQAARREQQAGRLIQGISQGVAAATPWSYQICLKPQTD